MFDPNDKQLNKYDKEFPLMRLFCDILCSKFSSKTFDRSHLIIYNIFINFIIDKKITNNCSIIIFLINST